MEKNKTYSSPSESYKNQLGEFYDLEVQIVINEMMDTLKPSLVSSEACQIVLQLLMQNAEYIKKNGKSEKAAANARQLIRLFELVSSFNDYTGNMNTLQLQNNEFYGRFLLERKKVVELQNKLNSIKESEEWGQS